MSEDREARLRPLQIPLLYAFRDAAQARDSRRAEVNYDASEARVLTERGSIRRRGANERQLRKDLDRDLANLVNTLNLGSTLPLDEFENVRKSILNFGMRDMTHVTMDAISNHELAEQLRQALLRHEPRLVADSIEVEMRRETDEVNHRIAFEVTAQMACRPVDIPLEFLAEIDVGSGKVNLRNLAESAAPRSARQTEKN